jgi:Fe2+ or Zn2+ uptake regulation protein
MTEVYLGRQTKIRSALLEILSVSKRPLSVVELLEKLAKKGLRPNKTTLYRDLKLFSTEQLVTVAEFGDGKTRYELTQKGHHHHLICQQCDKVEDVTLGKELEAEEERILKNKNFKILQHSLEFYGICGTCQIKT